MGVKQYADAFTFPLRKENVGILVLGLFVLSFLPTVLSYIPIGGQVVSGVINLFLTAYYAIFLQSILHASMQGEDRIPAWPDAGRPEDLFEDLVSIVVPFLVSFLPLILLRISISGVSQLRSAGFILQSSMPALSETSPLMVTLTLLFLVVGWLYFPMAVLVWTFYGGWSILNPAAVAKAAWQTGPSYLGLAVTVWLMVTAAWSVSLIPGQYITTFGSSLLVFYALVVAARMLGLHYRRHRSTLGWERQAPEPA
jgi:hypothetical protein